MRRALRVALAMAMAALAGCVDIPPDPLQLDRGMLTVDNHTAADWNDVEIWINRYYRVTVPKIRRARGFKCRSMRSSPVMLSDSISTKR